MQLQELVLAAYLDLTSTGIMQPRELVTVAYLDLTSTEIMQRPRVYENWKLLVSSATAVKTGAAKTGWADSDLCQ